jgi:hypothetical protein
MIIWTCKGGWQNKASCPKRGTEAVSGWAGREGPQGRGTQSNRAKQTQFRRREKQRQVLGGKGVMVNNTSDRHRQNKANFPPQGRSGDRRSQGGPGARNKANSSIGDCESRIGDGPVASGLRGPVVQTNPISSVGHGPGRRNVRNKAKLGQDGASGRQRIRGGRLCKTKPIRGTRQVD